MKLGDSPIKTHQELESVYGTSCSYDTVCRWIWRFQSGKKDLTVWSTKNWHGRECHRAGEAYYSRWPVYLKSGNNWNLLPFTWYNSLNYPRNARYEKGVCKVGTPLPDRGTHMDRVLNRCHVWTARAQTTDWCCHRRYKFHKLLWHALKTDKYGVKEWSRGQTSRPQPWISEQEAALHYIFNHAGPLVVDILPEKTTTSRHYKGTVLPKVVAAVQEQRANMGTTRTWLLHDNATPHKRWATSQYLEGEKSCPTDPIDLTALCDRWLFPLWKLALLERGFCEIKTLQERWIHNFMSYPLWNTTTLCVQQRRVL